MPRPDELKGDDFGSKGNKRRRLIEGEMNTGARKRMWIADDHPVVEGTPLSPFLRACLVADLTNPWANSGDGGLGYINSDVTLYLHRFPAGEWLGLDVVNHQASAGVAIAECHVYDEAGMIGTSSVAGLAQKRPPNPQPAS